jgi:ribose transport system substrate-binding protein
MQIRLRAPALAALLACGCAASEAPPAATASRPAVGVSLPTLVDPFFKCLADSLKGDDGGGCDFLVLSAESSPDRQLRQVQTLIAGKARAIVLCPCNPTAAGVAVRAANDAGIPVFTVAVPCTAVGALVVCHVGTDEQAGGREAAAALFEALGPAGGKVAVIDLEDCEAARLRLRGFQEALDRRNATAGCAAVTVVHEQLGGGTGPLRAEAILPDLLARHADLAGILALGDTATHAARAALTQYGKADAVKLVGFDEQPLGRRYVRRAGSRVPVPHHAEALAQAVARVVSDHLAHGQAPPQVLMPPPVWSDSTPVEIELGNPAQIRQAQALSQQASQHGRVGDFTRALAELRQAVQLAPTYADAHNNLAWFLLVTAPANVRDATAALAHARQAVELSGGQGVHRNTLGVALYRNRHFAQAVPELEKSLQAGRGRTDGYDLFVLAMCHHQLGDVPRARAEFDRAVRWFNERRAHPPDRDWLTELTAFQAEAEALLRQPPPRRP